ncbi:hypothetical protein SAMN05216559_0963 [Halomicrobium zhouii]|uniref:Uncharacterized protein n=2 Tax=Halomicrobium zhouii TaxID=767519 RepID=A0A1I6KKF6_9EURY|nr:hypothetical protein SAMN05216559_0963 [Halomicrobium zhouii]
MGDESRGRRSNTHVSDAMAQSGGTEPGSDFGWSDLLAVLLVGALLQLVIWYLLYGMGPLPSSPPA